jgi:hypothetical protein
MTLLTMVAHAPAWPASAKESARIKIAVAARGARYAPVSWRAHALANMGDAEPDPGAQSAADPWAGLLMRWLASRESTGPG